MILAIVEVFLFLVLGLSIVAQQPLRMGIFLLFYCFFSSLIVYTFFSSWFSFSLFLIYIGGMLVLFGYILVLVPNFVFSVKISGIFFLVLIIFIFSPSGALAQGISFFSFRFFGLSNMFVYLSLAIILFIALVSVAKVCFFQVGALRPFFLFYV